MTTKLVKKVPVENEISISLGGTIFLLAIFGQNLICAQRYILSPSSKLVSHFKKPLSALEKFTYFLFTVWKVSCFETANKINEKWLLSDPILGIRKSFPLSLPANSMWKVVSIDLFCFQIVHFHTMEYERGKYCL